MQFYQARALKLACDALDTLFETVAPKNITHVLVTSCTGFYAPGLDLQIVQHYGMDTSVELSIVGFMGCNAAMNVLKLARHIVRSDGTAKVLIVNIELCTLHLQELTLPESALDTSRNIPWMPPSPHGKQTINITACQRKFLSAFRATCAKLP